MFPRVNNDSLVALILIIIVAGAFYLGGGKFFEKIVSKSPDSIPDNIKVPTETKCCDSGDRDACILSGTERFTWKGTNKQAEEYALIKSGISLTEGGGHLAPSFETTPKGEKIFLNTSDRSANYSNVPGCDVGKDLVIGPTSCVGIPNDEVIYVCKSGCEAKVGRGNFDAYFRVKDGIIPDVIKNCAKPTKHGGEETQQEIILPTADAGRKNIQFKTFQVIKKAASTRWLSPYCKPAIYLYPKTKTLVSVRVNPVGKFTYTDPIYPPNGWKVSAEPSGKIISNSAEFPYLYYEANIPSLLIQKPEEGFVVEENELESKLNEILPLLGLNKKEADEMVYYWKKSLPESSYYFIGIVPQKDLDVIAPLSISPVPDNIIRVTLYFEPLDDLPAGRQEKLKVKSPAIKNTVRDTGFTVVEWGGVVKTEKPFACLQ